MNERIRELIKTKSTILFPGTDTVDCKITDIEKFAELIVRECAKKGFDIFDEEPDAPASDLQFYVRDRIKEHFGVES
jgi:hypothetical protein